MKKSAFLFLLLCACFSGKVAAEDHAATPERTQKFNVGVRTGFNSSMYFIDHFSVGGTDIESIQNNYKVGYFGAFFCRFNFKKHHFLQPEISYNISNGSIAAPKSSSNEEVLADNVVIKTSIHSLDVPLLYGYKFVDLDPYGMAFFIGPKASYRWEKHTENRYEGFHQQQINEEIDPIRFSALIGLAVNVGNVFFDFRYEIGLHNIIKGISFDKEATEAPYNEQDIVLKRRCNVLSFSVGVIF